MYVGDNFVRYSGDAMHMAKQQSKFSYQNTLWYYIGEHF